MVSPVSDDIRLEHCFSDRLLARLRGLDLHANQLSGCVPSNLQDQLDRTYTDLGGLPFC